MNQSELHDLRNWVAENFDDLVARTEEARPWRTTAYGVYYLMANWPVTISAAIWFLPGVIMLDAILTLFFFVVVLAGYLIDRKEYFMGMHPEFNVRPIIRVLFIAVYKDIAPRKIVKNIYFFYAIALNTLILSIMIFYIYEYLLVYTISYLFIINFLLFHFSFHVKYDGSLTGINYRTPEYDDYEIVNAIRIAKFLPNSSSGYADFFPFTFLFIIVMAFLILYLGIDVIRDENENTYTIYSMIMIMIFLNLFIRVYVRIIIYSRKSALISRYIFNIYRKEA